MKRLMTCVAAVVLLGSLAPRLSPVKQVSSRTAPRPTARQESTTRQGPATSSASISARLLDQPLHFAPNRGQAASDVRYVSHGRGFDLRLDRSGVSLALGRYDATRKLRLTFAGAAPSPAVTAEHELPGRMQYFFGQDPAQWIRDVPTYQRVRYSQIYPGIDAIYYGHQQRLEYDFVVAPEADPGRIRLMFDGADRLELGAAGELLVHVGQRYLREDAPVLYQTRDGARVPVAGRYRLNGPTEVRIEVDAYDRERPLVIDPLILGWSSYLGGEADDWIDGAAVNSKGELVVAGTMSSSTWPFTRNAALFSPGGGKDVFVSRFAADGTHLSTTMIGGENDDRVAAVALDPQDNIYLTGSTQSLQFPTTANAVMRHSESLQVTFGIGPIKFPSISTAQAGDSDAFVTRLDAQGRNVIYSTYLGGSPQISATLGPKHTNPKKLEIEFEANPGLDYGTAIATDGNGIAYVVGATDSTAFPVTDDAIKTDLNGFLDAPDGFIAKIDTNASGTDSLKFSSYLGGSCQDVATGVATDGQGHVYVTGDTKSPVICGGFTTTPGAAHTSYIGGDQDAWAIGLILDPKLNPKPGVFFSTFLGTTNQDWGGKIGVDPFGNVYVSYVEASSLTFGTLHVVKLARDGTQQLWDRGLGTTFGGSFTNWAPPTLFQGTFFPHGLFVTPFSLTTPVFAVRNDSTTYLDQFTDLANGSSVELDMALGEGNFVAAVTADASALYVAGGTTADTLTTRAAAQPHRNGGMDGFAASLTYNLPPIIHGLTVNAGREGDFFQGDVATYTEQSTTAASYTVVVNWGDGTSNDGGAGGGEVDGFHQYSDFGTYSGQVCLTRQSDKVVTCGAFTSVVADFVPQVTPVNTTVQANTLGAVYSPVVGSGGAQMQVTLNQIATFIDQGVHDRHTATVDWGDGSAAAPVPVVENQTDKRVGIASHVYTSGSLSGTENAMVCVTDRAAMSDCKSFTIQIPMTDLSAALTGPSSSNECAVPGYRLTIANNGAVDANNVTVTARVSDAATMGFAATTLLGASGGATTSSFLTRLPASNSAAFGARVAISSDDAVAEGWGQQPQVYHFDNNQLQWTEVATLPWEDSNPFGENHDVQALAIGGDTIVRGWDDFGVSGGRAVVYRRQAGVWSFGQLLSPSDLTFDSEFGATLALRSGTLAVGAGGFYSGNDGSVYIFTQGADGQWVQTQKIQPVIPSRDPTPVNFGGGTLPHYPIQFGSAVALSPDGQWLFVGAPTDYQLNLNNYLDHLNEGNGTVWVYQMVNGAFQFQTRLLPSGFIRGTLQNDFGDVLSASNDTLVVGWSRENSGAGAAFVFTLSNGTWSQIARLTSPDGGFAFGEGLALSGQQALIWGSNNGVYVYQRSGGTWTNVSKLTAPSTGPSVLFGIGLAMDNGRFLIGATGADRTFPAGTTPGAVYAFSACQQTEPGLLTCNVGSLPAGQQLTFGVNVSLGAKIVDAPISSATAPVSITAAVGGGALDSALSNNTATATTVVTNTNTACNDTTPPIVAPRITGTHGQNLWYTSNVQLDWLTADPESAFTTQGCDSVAISADTNGFSSTCAATSQGGTTTDPIVVRVDTTPPAITPIVALAPGSQSFAVSFTCNDAGSGVASCPDPTSMASGSNATFFATDFAGNTTTIAVDLPRASAGPPLAVAPAAGSCAANVTMQGSGFDATGEALTLIWSEGGQQIATGAAPTIVLVSGLHHLVLTVTNASGFSMSDSTDVTVTAPNVVLVGVEDQITVDATGVRTPVTVSLPTAMGCGITLTNNLPADFPAGNSSVLFTATDVFGRSASGVTAVNVRPLVDASVSVPAATIIAGLASSVAFNVTNAGPSIATEIDVLQQLPAGVVPVTVDTGQQVCGLNAQGQQTCLPIQVLSQDAACANTATGLKCSLFDVAPNETRTVTLSLGSPSNFARGSDSFPVSLTTAEPDSNSTNNATTGTLTVTGQADLALAFDNPPPTDVVAGFGVSYILRVTNGGVSDSGGFTITAPLGNGLSLSSSSSFPDGGSCSAANSLLTCASGPLPVGQTMFFGVGFHIDPSTRLAVTFSPTVQGIDRDPNGANNSLTATATVHAFATGSVSFAAAPATVTAGASTTFTALLGNTDVSDALNASAVVQLSPGATVGSVPPGCQIATGNASFTCSIAKIPASGPQIPLPFTIVADQFARGAVTATITLTTFEESEDSRVHVAQQTVPIVALVQPTLTMQASPSKAVAGLPLTYTITAGNGGPSAATHVRVDAPVPVGTTLTSASALYFTGTSPGAPVSCSGTTTVECGVPTLAVGDRLVLTMNVNVSSGALAQGNRLTGTATIAALESTSPVTADLGVGLIANADIRFTSLPPQSSTVVAGTTLLLTANVANAGPSDASNVTITVPIPSDGSWQAPPSAVQSNGCSSDGTSITCALGAVVAGSPASHTFAIGVNPSWRAPVKVNAQASATEVDPDSSNNSASAIAQTTAQATLGLDLSATPTPVIAGQTLSYTLQVGNLGPSSATGIGVALTLPDGTSAGTLPAACRASGQVVTCSTSDLAPQSNQQVHVFASVDQFARGTNSALTASAIARATEAAANAGASLNTAIETRTDAKVVVTSGPNPLVAGTFLTYTITVTNDGPSGAIGASLAHTLPPGVLVVSAKGTGSTCSNARGTIACSLPRLGTGDTAIVKVVAVPSAAGILSATSTVTVVEHDPDLSNNSVVSTTMVSSPSAGVSSLGDFNGDGALDLAVSDPHRDVVHIFFNDGHGAFIEHQQVAVGRKPKGVAVGDLDNDGDLDIAVANEESDSVSILENDGTGTFREVARVPTLGEDPSALALGDFDGDGQLDIAVANTGADNVSLLTRGASGDWTVKTRLAVGAGRRDYEPAAIAVADLNGDGLLDIAVGNHEPDSVSILFNAGAWQFMAPREIALRSIDDPVGLTIADFDNDGALDIAIVGDDRGRLGLLLNHNGSFTEVAVKAPIEDRPVAIAAGDLNGDGQIDLIVAAGDDAATLINGGGVFPLAMAAVIEAAPKKAIALMVGDVNGDGNIDLVVVDNNLTVSVLISGQPGVNPGKRAK